MKALQRRSGISGLLILSALALFIYLIIRSKQSTVVSNEETWKWVDWRGREREITAHRKVQAQ